MTGEGGASGGMMGMMGGRPNITGSIKLSTVMGNALSSQIKVGLSQAPTTAENSCREQFSCSCGTLWSCKRIFGIYCMGC